MSSRSLRGHRGRSLPPSGCAVLVISVMLLLVTMPGCIEQDRGPREDVISFSIHIRAEGPTELVLPLPMFGPIREILEVREGEGEIEEVATPYGDGLLVRLDSFVSVKAKIIYEAELSPPGLTINMTTMVPLEDESPEDKPKFWIPDREFWMNWTNGPLWDLSVSSRKTVDGTVYWYSSTLDASDLESGWNMIFVEGKSMTEFAP